MIPAMKLIMMTKVSVVFPACAVTKRMTGKVALEANNEDEGEDAVPNLDLEGTLFLMTQIIWGSLHLGRMLLSIIDLVTHVKW